VSSRSQLWDFNCGGLLSYSGCRNFSLRQRQSFVLITDMIIGDRLRTLREEKKFSQGDIEKRTGLLRCYISRVENGHTVPALDTIEKLARALEIPIYQLFYEGEQPPELPDLLKGKSRGEALWGSSGKEARFLHKLRRLMGQLEEPDRKILLYMAKKLSVHQHHEPDSEEGAEDQKSAVKKPFKGGRPPKHVSLEAQP
jgi:transcriptional regulator with XRE-family HTH domain